MKKGYLVLISCLATLLLGLGILKGNFLYHSHAIAHFDYLILIWVGVIVGMFYTLIIHEIVRG